MSPPVLRKFDLHDIQAMGEGLLFSLALSPSLSECFGCNRTSEFFFLVEGSSLCKTNKAWGQFVRGKREEMRRHLHGGRSFLSVL